MVRSFHLHRGGNLEGGTLGGEHFRATHLAGIVQLHIAQNISRLDNRTSRLHQRRDRAAFLRRQRQVHLHHLHLCEGLALIQVVAAADKEARQLSRIGAAKHRGIVLLREDAGNSVHVQSQSGRCFHDIGDMGLAIRVEQEASVRQLANLHLDKRVVRRKSQQRISAQMDIDRILHIVINQIFVAASAQQLRGRNLPSTNEAEILVLPLLELNEASASSSNQHYEASIWLGGLEVASNQRIQPIRIDLILHIALILHQLEQILDRGADFSSNTKLTKRLHHVLSSNVSGGAPREQMAKLRIRVLMHTARTIHREIAPHVGSTTEIQLANGSRSGLESRIRILCRDSAGNHMAARLDRRLRIDIDGSHVVLVQSVQATNVGNAVQRNSHRHLQLRGGEIHVCDHFRDRVLHLQSTH